MKRVHTGKMPNTVHSNCLFSANYVQDCYTAFLCFILYILEILYRLNTHASFSKRGNVGYENEMVRVEYKKYYNRRLYQEHKDGHT